MPVGDEGSYQQDLAYVHDAGFKFSVKAAPGLLGLLRRNGIRGGLVVDLGCGSGLWARRLTESGYDVLGVDLSASMIKLARKAAPAARFRCESYLAVKMPRCEAVTSLGECLNYLFDAGNTPAQLSRLFRRVHAALSPGGVFLFDLAGPGRIGPSGHRSGHWEGDDWEMFMDADEDRERRILTRRIVTFRRAGKLYRRSAETHRLRLHRPSDIAADLRRAGFTARVLRGYGSLRFSRGHAGFLARKRRR